MKIAIYFSYFYKIGGIESAIYYFCKHFREKYDITIYYRENNPEDYQIVRLSKIVKCVKYSGEYIDTDVLFVTGWDREKIKYIFDHTKAYEKVFWNHGHAQYIKTFAFSRPFDEIITVSKDTAKEWQLYGVQPRVLYTPVELEKLPKNNNGDKIRLITTSRMSAEKGATRMSKLIDRLNQENINFEWIIYSDHNEKFGQPKNVIFREPNLNVLPEIASSDILVQLSDSETFGLTPYEALLLGTNVIVTEFNTFKEMNPPKGSSFTLKFDCSNISGAVDFIKNYKNNYFDYSGIYSGWDRYLHRLDNNIKGIKNKTKVYIVKGKLDYEIKDLDYVIITDTEQNPIYNYKLVNNIDDLTYKEIINYTIF